MRRDFWWFEAKSVVRDDLRDGLPDWFGVLEQPRTAGVCDVVGVPRKRRADRDGQAAQSAIELDAPRGDGREEVLEVEPHNDALTNVSPRVRLGRVTRAEAVRKRKRDGLPGAGAPHLRQRERRRGPTAPVVRVLSGVSSAAVHMRCDGW